MSTNNLTTLNSNDTNRIYDYFVVTGLPPKLTAQCKHTSEFKALSSEEHEKLLFKNIELEAQNLQHDKIEPIVDIAIFNRTLNEGIPNGYQCLWETPAGHSGNLCCETMFKQNEMYLLIKRGNDRPPITDIGVFYEGTSERVMDGCTIIKKTVGDNSANLNTSSFNTNRVFVTYRRAAEIACNSLAVIDVCLIVKNKGESAPHSFNEIQKNLNLGFLGSSLYLCYKKAWIPAPQIKYIPTNLYRYPLTDHTDLPFPNEIASFGLPMGAVIESWPISLESSSNNLFLCNLKPIFSTFVLNVNSDDGIVMEKVYGSSITFYEDFDESKLSDEQALLINYRKNDILKTRTLHSNKSLIILSRFPLFDTFRNFLVFLFNKYTLKIDLTQNGQVIPMERYLSYLMYEVPFPSHQKPHVMVNLNDKEEDCLSINLPNEIILPQSGASFIDLIHNLGVENSINVFLFVLLQRSVMVHSLRRQVLTSVVEALSCTIFPFIWRYSYIPMCPLSLCTLIEAPGSFIIGMDTRFFDMFDAPQNVICVDLDTNTISWTPDRQNINLKILPRKVYNLLKNKLQAIANEAKRLNDLKNYYQANNQSQISRQDFESKLKKSERNLELAIREAFLKAMIHILYNYKSFMRTVTRRPDMKALDRNLSKFFDCEGFIRSKETSCQYFYRELTRTQLFYDCIMNLSFTSELEPALADGFAFFADQCSKLNPQLNREDETRILFDLNDLSNSQTVVIMPPSLDSEFQNQLNQDLLLTDNTQIIQNGSAFCYDNKEKSFPRLVIEIYEAISSKANSISELDRSGSSHKLSEGVANTSRKNSCRGDLEHSKADTQSISSANAPNPSRRLNKVTNTPMGVRTPSDKIQANKRLDAKFNLKVSNNQKQNEKNKNLLAKFHAYYFLSNAYALWFIYLPEYIKDCGEMKKNGLNYAYQVLIQMQKHNLTQPDEMCFRIMMQLCQLYKFPTLAVKTLLNMRKYRIEIEPITYSYYNKALIETSSWPSFDQDRWAKIRLIWLVIGKFKYNLKLKKEREQKNKSKRSKSLKKKKLKSQSSLKNSAKKTNILPNGQLKKTDVSNSVNFSINSLEDDASKSCQKLITKRQNRQSESDRHEKTIVRSSKNPAVEKFEKQTIIVNLPSNQTDLIIFSSGILIFSTKLFNSSPNTYRINSKKANLKKFRSFDKNLDLKINFLDKESIKPIKKENSFTPITKNDPLGAFSPQAQSETSNLNKKIELDSVKRKLFDKTFAEEQPTIKSDFIYETSKPQDVSYDSDEYTDGTYDTDEEFDEDQGNSEEYSDEYDDEEDGSDVEVDKRHFNGKAKSLNSDLDSNDRRSADKVSLNKNENNTDAVSTRGSIDIENILVSSSLAKSLKTPNGKEEPKKVSATSSFGNFASPMSLFNKTKVVSSLFSSIESSGSKLKGMKEFLTDKSIEIKDAILANTNQQELTSKIKSISNYNLKASQKYFNGFVKSTSTFSVQLTSNQAREQNMSQTSLEAEISSLKNCNYSLDLDPVPVDDTYKPLSLNWWGLDKNLTITSESNEVLVDIQISSCNYCENCKSFLYDEEIMSGWTLNESDLNIKCLHCQASLVPNLYIKIQDFENVRKFLLKNNDQETKSVETNKNLENSHPLLMNLDNPESKLNITSNEKNELESKINSEDIIVQYLSPLVVRKELENIIVNNYSQDSEETCFINEKFMNEHKIIFWNLIWYFKRIGVDSGHLATILLNSRLSQIKEKFSIQAEQIDQDKFEKLKFKNFIPIQTTETHKQHPYIKIKCLWDNLKLHDQIIYHEVPLYLTWLLTNYPLIQNQMKNRLITILTINDLTSMRKTSVNSRSLAKLYELIIRNIKESDIIVPFRSLLRERLRSKINYTSIYREILYLVITALERDLIDIDAFDSEYREAYKSLIENEAKSLIKNSDRPPNNVAVWCRRLFSPLLV